VKADLERVPYLCLTDDTASWTLFQRLWNVVGAWIKPALVACWAVGLEKTFCAGGGLALAIAYPSVLAVGFALFFFFSSLKRYEDHVDIQEIVLGVQEPLSSTALSPLAPATRSDRPVGDKLRKAGVTWAVPDEHMDLQDHVEGASRVRCCTSCRTEINESSSWMWCGACRPATNAATVCGKCWVERAPSELPTRVEVEGAPIELPTRV